MNELVPYIYEAEGIHEAGDQGSGRADAYNEALTEE